METRTYRLLRSDADYDEALRDAEQLVALDPAAETAEGEHLGMLTLLIEDYERRHYPLIENPGEVIDSYRTLLRKCVARLAECDGWLRCSLGRVTAKEIAENPMLKRMAEHSQRLSKTLSEARDHLNYKKPGRRKLRA
jgi:hypothetical protein